MALGSRNLFRPDPRAADVALALDAADAQKAATALFGDPGFFDSWQRSQTFSMDGVLAPFGVEVVAEGAVFDTEADALSVGLAWDDGSLLEAKPVELQSGGAGEKPGTTIFRVNAVRGRTLEVWTSGFDKFGTARIVSLADAAVIEKKAAEDAKAPNVVDPKAGASDLGKKIGIGVAVVVALVVLVNVLPLLFRKAAG